MRALSIFFSVEDFWDFLVDERRRSSKQSSNAEHRVDLVSLDEMISGYLKFRDPLKGGDKAVMYMRNLFDEADVDGSGLLSRAEYTKVFRVPKNIEKLAKLGMLGACHDFENEQDMEDYLVLFFHDIDGDFTGTLSVQELVDGFINLRNEMRLRTLDRMVADGESSNKPKSRSSRSSQNMKDGGKASRRAQNKARKSTTGKWIDS